MLQQRIMPTGIKAIIYDIDNCVAPLSNDDITHSWDPYLAKEFGLALETAAEKRRHYFETVGCTLRGYAAEYGRNMTWADTVYAETGEASGLRFVSRHTPVARLTELFGHIHAKGVLQLVVTQGHPNHYGHITRHIGLHAYVPANGFTDRTHPVYEKLEDEVWLHIVSTHGLQPHEFIVLEDTPRNLVRPAALGMHTMLIGNRDPGPAADSIHWRYEAAEAGLEDLLPHL
ncbi:MAG: hypothetical protein EON60_09845 [Alphaproteobacteria bacterium]|nr:MAG: hypothetical protein EON60_09845 [Alphaproteobacteria bacterium]